MRNLTSLINLESVDEYSKNMLYKAMDLEEKLKDKRLSFETKENIREELMLLEDEIRDVMAFYQVIPNRLLAIAAVGKKERRKI